MKYRASQLPDNKDYKEEAEAAASERKTALQGRNDSGI